MFGNAQLTLVCILCIVTPIVFCASISSEQTIKNRFGKKYRTCDKELKLRKFILCSTFDLYIDDMETNSLIGRLNRVSTSKIEDCCIDGCSDLSLMGFCLGERAQYTINNNMIDGGEPTNVKGGKQAQSHLQKHKNRIEVGTVAPEYNQVSINRSTHPKSHILN